MKAGKITGVNGPVLTVEGCDDFHMAETVTVSERRLTGEVIRIKGGTAVVQVFEDTAGLTPGEYVYPCGGQTSVTLAPGILGGIFDGIQRPLKQIEAQSGVFIPAGNPMDDWTEMTKWHVTMRVKANDVVYGGAILAEVPETPAFTHKILLPPFLSGTINDVVSDGSYTIYDVLATLTDANGKEHPLTMAQKWPIRVPRPIRTRRMVDRPLITGQRVVDTLFPIAKGGMAALPGGFGTGKTITQHQFAKWSDADIIIYVGCGERGNEMTQVLEDFSALKDPKTGRPLMERTALVANTSNMPVAAREASIYTGLTMAEYYRDMGQHVAIMADSTSRWAEALRELSGRLEEMPAEEGFPAYLASKLSAFYERAGYVENLNGTEGSVTIIGAVSPQGGDFSEPVTQQTKRFVRCFWALDRTLAYARHFPAIQWQTSYSEYLDDLQPWYVKNVGEHFLAHRAEILKILNEESRLMDIVKLIGADVLPDEQKLVLEIARVIRLGFIQQNAYHAFDAYVPLVKQKKMMAIILHLYAKCLALTGMNIPVSRLQKQPIFERVIAIKYDVGNDEMEKLDTYLCEIDTFYEMCCQEKP